MKRLAIFAAVICHGISSAAGQHEATGLLVVGEGKTSAAEALEYRSILKGSANLWVVTGADGNQKRIKADSVRANIDYPPNDFDQGLPSLAASALDKIRALEGEWPRLSLPLAKARGKWERALSSYQQTNKKPDVSTESLPIFEVNKARYSNVRMTSANYETATITHSTGVTRLRIADLTTPQIIRLNQTSDSRQIGTAAADEARAVARAGSTLTTKLRKKGMRLLEIFAERIGLETHVMTTWLIFVIFPALIIGLVVGNVVQSRKMRSLVLKPARGVRT